MVLGPGLLNLNFKVTLKAVLMKILLGKKPVVVGRPGTQEHRAWQTGRPSKLLTSRFGFGVKMCSRSPG